MKNDIHRHLDGELSAHQLAPDEKTVVDEWDRMVAAFRRAEPSHGGAPPWLEQKVMGEIEALPREGLIGRTLGWLVRPAQVRVPPLAAGVVMAAFAAVLAWPSAEPAGPDVAGGVTESVVFVQFVLEAPGAQSVAVVGDFSEWEPTFTLDDTDGDGVWTGRVPIQPGVHSYMFLVDGSDWQTDPNAERYSDDGFGNQNAVLAVSAGD